MKQGMILVMTMGMRSGIGMNKYKLYGLLCRGSCTTFTTNELARFVAECIIGNGGKCFDIWCDDYYIIMNKE